MTRPDLPTQVESAAGTVRLVVHRRPEPITKFPKEPWVASATRPGWGSGVVTYAFGASQDEATERLWQRLTNLGFVPPSEPLP